MKIIDFERKGNLVRFYLGADDCTDYWGDDWNDAPYECNAGTVYDRYVKGVMDIVFPFNALVLEPSSSWRANTQFSKEDMKNRVVPCIIVVPEKLASTSWHDQFEDWVGAKDVMKMYFGDVMNVREWEGVAYYESY